MQPILHLTLFNPVDDHYGLSPIEAAANAVDVHNAAGAWNKALIDNSARPSGALVYESRQGLPLAEEQFERLKAELEQSFQGALNAGRPLLLEGGLDWRPLSLSPKDMDFVEAKHAAAREIALAFGVPPMLLGLPGDNTFANYAEANCSFWRQTVLPLVGRTAQSLAAWLAPDEPGLRLQPDLDRIDALSAERGDLWSRIGAASFLTDDEKRAAVGYGAAPGGAVKYSPDQPRVPAGNTGAGRWTSEIGSGLAGGFRQWTGSGIGDATLASGEGLGNLIGGGQAGGTDTAEGDTTGSETLTRVLDHLNAAAHSTSTRNCAQYVRQALEAGGITISRPAPRPGNKSPSAADYGPSLIRAGARIVADVLGQDAGAEPAGFPPPHYQERAGDVIIFPSFPGHPHGHMAMSNGKRWVSDFRQNVPWPNQTRAKSYGPSYRVYRFPKFGSGQ